MNASRVVLFACTALLVALFYVPLGHADYQGRWGEGTYGLETDRTQSPTVIDVVPGTPAQRAGVHAGDRLVVIPFARDFIDAQYPFAGERRTFHFVRPDARAYDATMTAIPTPNFGIWDRIGGVVAILPATAFLVVAFILVLLRPGVMSWSFYVYAAGYFSTGPAFEFYRSYLPSQAYIGLSYVLTTVLGAFSVLPLIPFILRFPEERVTGWRRVVDAISWAVMSVAFVLYSVNWWTRLAYGTSLPAAEFFDRWLPLGAFVVAALILAKKIKLATPQTRERLRFLSVGVFISFVAYGVYYVPGVSYALKQIVGYVAVLMPITIAYAVFRHRVIGVNFVLNRALGYGVLSVIVVAVVSVLDYAFASVVSKQHFALFGELGITVAIGFLLDRINKWISSIFESTFFRHRKLAEEHLRRAADALPFATEEAAVTDGLTQIPADALRLTAAAIYRVTDEGHRYAGIGTSSDTMMAPARFDQNHLLVRMLQSSEAPVWLDEVRHYLDAENSGVYVLAIPVTVRHELVAFTLYGAHRNGAQIDSEELALLRELAREASRAYDHVEAVRARERFAAARLTYA